MTNSGLYRSKTIEMLSMVPRPPNECRAFLVALEDGIPNYVQQADAMWISNQTGTPTLNGLSTWTSPGWELDQTTHYLNAAKQWIARHGLRDNACIYERSKRRWSLFQ